MTTTQQLLQQAAQTVIALQRCSESLVQDILNDTASALLEHMADILEANREDLSRMDISNPKYDRLKLTESRIECIAQDMRNVSTLPSPLGKIYSEVTRPNGMTIKKVSVPFGVIGVIYEARPNVTCDVFSLCLKSGNVCILKGGSDADCSNQVLVKIIHQIVEKYGVNPAKRKAMAVKNEKRFLKQKRNALKNPGYSHHPVKTQASFKRLLKAV